ncbi:hypothetical protein D3C87_1729890 [compost metagenome]
MLAASIDVLLLHRIVMDRDEKIRRRRHARPLAQLHFRAVRRHLGHAVAGGTQIGRHQIADVQVVQVLHPPACARRARPAQRVPGIHDDMRGLRRQRRQRNRRAERQAGSGP